MKHDAWMNDLFWDATHPEPTHAFVLCDLWSDCPCDNVACGRSLSTRYTGVSSLKYVRLL